MINPSKIFSLGLGDKEAIFNVFSTTNQEANTFDVTVKVGGGGITGQTDSVKLGLARAIGQDE